MNNKKQPIFYHPESCECLECAARSAEGGLDFDPSNDNAEFEKHEEEINLGACLSGKEIKERAAKEPKMASEIKKGDIYTSDEDEEGKPMIFTREFKIGQMIKFNHVNDITGDEKELSGIIKGFGDAVRKKWPIEMAEAPDNMMLIWRQDNLGQEFHHAISPFEVVDVAFVKEDK